MRSLRALLIAALAFCELALGQIGVKMTYRSASAGAQYDVVVLNTSNSNSVDKSTSALQPYVVGTLFAAATQNTQQTVYLRGGFAKVNVVGNVAIGDLLVTSSTAGKARTSASAEEDITSFATALTAVTGPGTVDCFLFTFSTSYETPVFETLSVTGETSLADLTVDSLALTSAAQTDDGTWEVDVTDNAVLFAGTITQNTTIAAPNDTSKNRVIIFRIKQDGTGSRVLTWNSVYSFGHFSSIASTAAGTTDYWAFVWNATDSKWDCITSRQHNLRVASNFSTIGTVTVGTNLYTTGFAQIGLGVGGGGHTLFSNGDIAGDGGLYYPTGEFEEELEVGGGGGSGGHTFYDASGGAVLTGPVTVVGDISSTGTLYSGGDFVPDKITLDSQSQADDGTWTINSAEYPLNYGTVTQATAVSAPSETAEGRIIWFRVKQGTGGSLTWDAAYSFGIYDSALSSTPNAVQMWEFVYNSVDSKWTCLSGPLPITSYGYTLLANANASDARSDLSLGTIATQNSNSVTVTGGSVTGITDITVADGGTGSSTANDARTALGLAIGTNVQAYDADLLALAGLTSAANKVPRFSGSGTAALIDVVSGTWTTTVSGTVNADSTTPYSGPYLRISDMVQATFSVDFDATAAASTTSTFEASLPVSSNFASSGNLGGIGTIATNPQVVCEVQASSANDTCFVTWKSNATTSARVRVTILYQIL